MTGSTSDAVKRILAVDDDPVNRHLIRAILTRARDPALRHTILFEATSLLEARAVLDREPVDLLLLDVHLPDGLGLELATELQRDPAGRPAIIALTASVLPVDQQAALDAGCDAFLAKPYGARALVATVSGLLVERAMRQPPAAPRG